MWEVEEKEISFSLEYSASKSQVPSHERILHTTEQVSNSRYLRTGNESYTSSSGGLKRQIFIIEVEGGKTNHCLFQHCELIGISGNMGKVNFKIHTPVMVKYG